MARKLVWDVAYNEGKNSALDDEEMYNPYDFERENKRYEGWEHGFRDHDFEKDSSGNIWLEHTPTGKQFRVNSNRIAVELYNGDFEPFGIDETLGEEITEPLFTSLEEVNDYIQIFKFVAAK